MKKIRNHTGSTVETPLRFSRRRAMMTTACAGLALALSAAPLTSVALFHQTDAYAGSNRSEAIAAPHALSDIPACASDAIHSYIRGEYDIEGLDDALSNLADQGLITNSQLDAFMAAAKDGTLETLLWQSERLGDASKDTGSKPDIGNQGESDGNQPDPAEATDQSGTEESGNSQGATEPDESSPADPATSTTPEGNGEDAPADPGTETPGQESEEPSSGPESQDPGTPSNPAEDADPGAGEIGGGAEAAPGASDAITAPEGTAAEMAPAPAQQPSANPVTTDARSKHPLAGRNKPTSADKNDADDRNSNRQYPDLQKVRRATHNMSTEQFIAVIGEQARQIGQDNNLYASVMIAQAILESDSGRSLLSSAPFNNLFGIKGSNNGQSVTMSTKEDDGTGHYYTIDAIFRSYGSYSESLKDYANLLTNEMGEFYSGAWKSNAETPYKAAEFLQGRYATSTSYAMNVAALINTYNLTQYDQPLPYEPDQKYTVMVVDENGNVVEQERTIADVLAVATTYLGTDYVWGGSSPETGFDCSGLVQYSYQSGMGISLPRTTYVQCKVGTEVDINSLQPGDMLFFDRDGDVHHVALYLGNGFYIHAPSTGDVVKVTALEDYTPSFAVRVVSTHERGAEPEATDSSQEIRDAADGIVAAIDEGVWVMLSDMSDSISEVIEED